MRRHEYTPVVYREFKDTRIHHRREYSRPKANSLLTLLFPDAGQVYDRLHRPLHILHTDIFVPAMEGHLPGKEVGTGKPHERKTRSVGPSPGTRSFNRDTRPFDGFYRIFRHL